MNSTNWSDEDFVNEAKSLASQYNILLSNSQKELFQLFASLKELVAKAQKTGLSLHIHNPDGFREAHPQPRLDFHLYRTIDYPGCGLADIHQLKQTS